MKTLTVDLKQRKITDRWLLNYQAVWGHDPDAKIFICSNCKCSISVCTDLENDGTCDDCREHQDALDEADYKHQMYEYYGSRL